MFILVSVSAIAQYLGHNKSLHSLIGRSASCFCTPCPKHVHAGEPRFQFPVEQVNQTFNPLEVSGVVLFEGKGAALECGSYLGIELLDHVVDLLERVIEKR